MKLSAIRKNPENPRIVKDDKFAKLKKSIQDFPQMMELRPIVVDASGMILGGNMRFEAIRSLGMKDIPDAWVKQAGDLTEDQKAEFIVKDNVGFGEWNWGAIALDWDHLPLSDWGLDVPDIETVEAEETANDAEPQIDKAAELNKKWQVKPGDLWQIGEHRLLCGDSTKREDVERVMESVHASMCFTSPPYNAGVSAQLRGNTSIGDNLYGDKYDDDRTEDDYCEMMSSFTLNALERSDYVFINLQMLAGNKRAVLMWLSSNVEKFADVAVWDKKHAAPQQAQRVMDSRFEFIFILSNNASRAVGTREFRGMVHNVYEGSPQRHNEFASSHAATMPVDLPTHFIKTFSNSGESVYEPFAGSGTTLVAAQNLNRKCYAIEIAPDYCAVILQRMTDAFPALEVKRI